MSSQPLIAATWSFSRRWIAAALETLDAGGSAVDGVEHLCRLIEADPEIDSVGQGGLPNSQGTVSLDACVMASPGRCGGVCGLEAAVHAISVARAVMEETGQVLLSGSGADAFAKERGLVEGGLLTSEARRSYEKWKKTGEIPDQATDVGLRPIDSLGEGRLFAPGEQRYHDTVGVLALDRERALAGGCSTSGMPFKAPGRIGDSPIIGHGLYVDPDVGAVTATGDGELIMGCCGSFAVIESMRRGVRGLDAIVEILERINVQQQVTTRTQVAFIAMTPDGGVATGALRPGYRSVIGTAAGVQVVEPEAVIRAD